MVGTQLTQFISLLERGEEPILSDARYDWIRGLIITYNEFLSYS